MKKLLTLFDIILTLSAVAQKYPFQPADVKVKNMVSSRAVADTLLWNVIGFPQLYLMPNPLNPSQGIGFLAGTDNLVSALDPPNKGSITEENAQIFVSQHKIKVLGAKFTFGSVKYVSNDTNSKVIFKLFKLDGSFLNYSARVVPGPGTVVSVVEMPIRDVKQLASGVETLFTGAQNIMFPTPLDITPGVDSGYAIGFDISQLDYRDTLGLFTSMINGPIVPERSLVKFYGNPLFNSFRDTLDYGGWGVSVDLAIFPIIDPNQYRNDVATTCDNQPYNFNGKLLSVTGTYVDTFSAAPISNYDTIVTLQLTVVPGPNKTVIAMGDTLDAVETGATYQWYNCTTNTPISGEISRTFIAPGDGFYKVAINNGNCTAFSDCIAVGIVGIKESGNFNFSLSPNPVKDHFRIDLNETDGTPWSTSLYNIQGQLVKPLFENQNGTTFTFQTSGISSGMYFIRLSNSAGKSGVKKVVIE